MIGSNSPTLRFSVCSSLFSLGLPALSFAASFASASLSVLYELRKRKLHKESQGKILFMETARKKKSTQHIGVTIAHLITSTVVYIFYFSVRRFQSKVDHVGSSFALTLAAIVSYTLLGFFHSLIYLSIKKTQIEDNFSDLLERHSLRKSIRSVRNVPLVSGGFKPKNSAVTIACNSHNASANTTNFGIFIGCDEDEDDNDLHTESPKSLSLRSRLCGQDLNEEKDVEVPDEAGMI